MNRKSIPTALVIMAAVLLATSAFATDITVTKSLTLNGKEISPGQYKVVYTGSGSDVQVNFLKGKNTVASAPARIEERDKKSNYDAVITENAAGGAPAIKQILLGGKKQVLVFSGEGGSSASMGSR